MTARPEGKSYGPMERYEAESAACGALHALLGAERHVVAQIVETEFIVGGVGNVAFIGRLALRIVEAGYAFGETAELSANLAQVALPQAEMEPGEYRSITGAEALALGLAAAGELADRSVMFCSYPITPASPLLHQLTRLADLGVGTFQAEDEIAAIGVDVMSPIETGLHGDVTLAEVKARVHIAEAACGRAGVR